MTFRETPFSSVIWIFPPIILDFVLKSRVWIRTTEPWIMSPVRFHYCATLFLKETVKICQYNIMIEFKNKWRENSNQRRKRRLTGQLIKKIYGLGVPVYSMTHITSVWLPRCSFREKLQIWIFYSSFDKGIVLILYYHS